MEQTRAAITQTRAERLFWQAARRDDARIARRLSRTQVVDGVYRMDEGALLDDCFHCLHELGGVDWLHEVQATAVPRVLVPCVQYVVRYGRKPLYGVERMHALPAVLCSEEALLRLVGFNAHQVRQGVCRRGAATPQGSRTEGPIGPDTLAANIVKLHRRDLEALGDGVMRALAKTGAFAARVTGMVEATDLETTAQDEGWGHVTRKRRFTDTRGPVHAIESTV